MFELKKIGIVKRASAWFLDAILLAVLTTGFMFLISLCCNYEAEQARAREYFQSWEDFRTTYLKDIAPYYGFDYEETETEYTITKDGDSATLDDVMKALVDSEGNDDATAEAYAQYMLLPPPQEVNKQYQYVYSLLFMMISIGLLLAYVVLEFIVPLGLKNGQTVGKKVFSIGLVRPDCVSINTLSLFARTFIGKFAIETMFPILLVFLFFFGGIGLLAVILLAALILLNAVLFFTTKNRTPIHDILASTVVIDLSLQAIYRSEDEFDEGKALAKAESTPKNKD